MGQVKNKTFTKISHYAVISFILVVLGIASLVLSLYVIGKDFWLIFEPNESNPMWDLFHKTSLFFENKKNIIFFSLFYLGLIFLYIGCVLLPLMNVINVTKTSEKSLFKPTFFTTPMVLVWLPFFPIVWLVCIFTTISKATTFAKLNVQESFDHTPNNSSPSLIAKNTPQNVSNPAIMNRNQQIMPINNQHGHINKNGFIHQNPNMSPNFGHPQGPLRPIPYNRPPGQISNRPPGFGPGYPPNFPPQRPYPPQGQNPSIGNGQNRNK